MENIKANVIKVLGSVKQGEDFEKCEDLIKQGLLDSFAMINLIGELEDEFDIEIGAQNIVEENFKSVDCIAAMILRLLEEE